MQLRDFLCYILLTITVTSSCAKAEDARQKRELAIGKSRKLLKRDASIIIDHFPIEPMYTPHSPKIIYRRVSRQKYGPPKSKSKYRTPRPKYGPPQTSRKPTKKHRKPISPPIHKRRTPKPKYGSSKRPNNKPVYGPPTNPPHYNTLEPAGFAEPPTDYEPHQQPQQNYAEPPVDSYGAPLKLNEAYPTAQAYENPSHFLNHEFTNFAQEFQSWQNNYVPDLSQDNSYAHSKKRPLFVKPDEIFNIDQNQEAEDFNLKSYPSDGVTFFQSFKEPQYLHNRKREPQFFDKNRKVNKHWTAPRFRQKNKQDDEILVGGQYAEPPPRYVSKFQPSAPMYNGDDDFAPPQSFVDSEVAASATISPYVNYKHSNMAFSPQNLNDAFSIVDK